MLNDHLNKVYRVVMVYREGAASEYYALPPYLAHLRTLPAPVWKDA
jgi:hypothetical protein